DLLTAIKRVKESMKRRT
uniref:Cupiennin-7b n=1 Tax=Cupiennius salei TaxID=6928 RepID=TXC7B_CUPSA|nr:RecName: Full=Cupiennin-7b; Short=Cu-7b; AltName: Full=Short cationic peptide-5b; Short=SCP-5b [Cupiennius salei]